MYKLTLPTGNVYTIPKENLKMFALYQAMNSSYNKPIKSNDNAIKFFEFQNIKVEDYKDGTKIN